MKTLTKLALVSAVAISGNAFALQSLDDSDLSSTTGQDGIDIVLSGGITADALVIHDNNGITGSGLTAAQSGITTPAAGAIVLGKYGTTGAAGDDFSITGGDITVKIDADANGTAPVLNINVGLPAALTINTGEISVASSGGIAAAANAQYGSGTGAHSTRTNVAKVLDNLAISLNGATLNIQLGNQPQGALIKLGGNITGGLNIANLNVLQGANGIRLGNVNIRTKDSADWALTGNINAVANGLAISGLGNVDVRLTNVKLGSTIASTMGDVALLGLALPTVTIGGH